jgi:hypothetical protein
MGVPEHNTVSTANCRLRDWIGKDAAYSPGLACCREGHVLLSKPPDLGGGQRLTSHHVPNREGLRG